MCRALFALAVLAHLPGCGSRPATRPGGDVSAIKTTPAVLDTLESGQRAHGFTAESLYLDGRNRPIGARFKHGATGFTFDYLAIESAPQGFLWVNSLPTSDKGEPHTQEHLLLGKGDRGRRLGSVEAMALGESSAFTAQWRTCYHFHTVAGPEAYWTVFENQLDAMLNPDYTDEEIRREVAHYGPADGDAGGLRLEEKGTVYSEMVRTFEQPNSLAWRAALRLVHGQGHPLALSAGGLPDEIRRMTPEDIRSFHQRNYHLGNMGLIGAYPAAMALDQVLARTGALLDKLAGRTGPETGLASVPPAKPAAAGAIEITEYPYHDAASPGSLMLAWSPTRALDPTETLLLEHLISAVAGDEGTNLYQLLVDSKTRTLDTGATGVWGWVSPDPGLPIFVGLSKVASAHLDEEGAARVRSAIRAELSRLAGLDAADADLAALTERVKSRLVETRRALAKQLNTPPGFGVRGTGYSWMGLLLDLEKVAGFKKSLTRAPEIEAIERLLAAPGNPWRERLARWGLLDEPFAVVARPSPAERERLERERDRRLAAEAARLAEHYEVADRAEALRRFAADYETTTRALEDGARAAAMPPLVDALPMTLDDGIDAREHQIAGVPAVTSTFASTTAGTAGLALRLDGVPAELQVYLALLPELLSEAGLVIDGVPVPADEVLERQRREILAVGASLSSDERSGRLELVLEGQGLDPVETRRAIGWMVHILSAPDWRPENLPRLRDLADRRAVALRGVMQGPEEGWAANPAAAYRRQESPAYLHAASFLTAAHDAHRVRWMLRDPGQPAAREAAARFLDKLAGASRSLDRARMTALAAALAGKSKRGVAVLARWLPPKSMAAAARDLVREAGVDLAALVPDLPDQSLAADWRYLCHQMAADLRRTAPVALADLERLRGIVVRAAAARLYVVGAGETQEAIRADLERLVGALGTAAALPRSAPGPRHIDQRVRAREGGGAAGASGAPGFVGLVNPSTQGGVFLHSAPATHFLDRSEDALLDYLAGNLYTGHGAHSLFMKTWAAGLAYSNGIRVMLRQGLLQYYAERCPDLSQTLGFVIGELGKARPEPGLASYALAIAFQSRVAATYERRGRAIAEDLADGVAPAEVRRFRQGLLELQRRVDFADQLSSRLARVYQKVLPGFGPSWSAAPGALYMVIGPDRQLESWQRFLHKQVDPKARLVRIYPRDFWIPAALPARK